MRGLPPSPFLIDGTNRFDDFFDETAFMEAIEPRPAFLAEPRPEYLEAIELIPVLEILAGHIR